MEKKEAEKKDVEKKGAGKKEAKKPKRPTVKEKQAKQLKWAVVLMVSIILIVILVPLIKRNFIDKFTYANLDFQKTALGDIIFYSTRIPLVDLDKQQITGSYTINFRSDPRKIEEIDTKISGNNIVFKKNATVYITLDPEMEVCQKNTVALTNLAGFLKGFGDLDIQSAIADEEKADELGFPYIDCKKHSWNNTVIYVTSGNETSIKRSFKNHCYEVTYANCEIVEVTERFMMIIIENYMSYFSRE